MATNQLENQTGVLSDVSYDSNGNLLSVTNAGSSGLTMTYDGSNRVHSATVGSGTEYYGYDANGHRVYRKLANGTEEWTLYGIQGEKLGTFSMVLTCGDWTDPTTCDYEPAVETTDIWFGGKLVWSGTGSGSGSGPDFADHLGTNRVNGARFYPYGDEITSTGSDRVKFATYERSSLTGLDYADQRYYANTYGRFTTVDPSSASADSKTPQSWNRYVYALGDPVNGSDPGGLCVLDNQYNYWDNVSDVPAGGWVLQDFGDGSCDQDQTFLAQVASSAGGAVSLNGSAYSGASGDGGGPQVFANDLGNCSDAVSCMAFAQGTGGNPASSNSASSPPCETTVLNAINSQFGTSLTAGDVLNSTSLLPQPCGQVNLNIGVDGGLTAGQFNVIQPGRYAPPGLLGWLTGWGPSLHVVGTSSSLDPSALTFANSNDGGLYSVIFTAHIDSAWANNPIGALLHWTTDVLGNGTRNPCP